MDFLLCLAHFCEIHGPTPIICTQAILCPVPGTPTTPPSAQASPDAVSKDTSDADQLAQTYLPNSSSPRMPLANALPASSELGGTEASTAGVAGGCQSCSLSFPTECPVSALRSVEKMITPPEGMQLVYLSTPNARSKDRYSALRQLCMNSLSLDLMASDRTVFFGDGQIGYAVALFFRIRDEMARGSNRTYAIICANDRESQLQDAWHIIAPALEDISRWIVTEADAARNSRLIDSMNSNESGSTTRSSAAGLGGITLPDILTLNGTSDNYLRRHYEPKPRNLVDLTGRKDIFIHIHLSFAVTLSTLSREITKGVIKSGLSRF
ncbi:vesicle coat protein [Lipomyces kononenkoae]|uniref:Vesicle coat protein n=1 Tax=Lipomyces kononenkoae TaxID=34357 RepID=A0ACC3TAU3_LIPKO